MPREGIDRAKSLRRRMTSWERTLWKRLRADRLGFHFRRQHPFGPYILDFYCHEARLCVELDSEAHQIFTHRQDSERDAYLEAHGIATLRLKNSEVGCDPLGSVQRILATCKLRSEPTDRL